MKQLDFERRLQISRRKLLIATGLGGASLFLPSLGGRAARAQSTPIKRLVIMTTQHGTVPSNWRMPRNNSNFGDWEYAFDDPDPMSFSPILRPLHEHRSSLLVIEGLALTSALGDRNTNNHNAGHLHALTAAKMMDDNNAGGPSVDQIIAGEVAVPGRIPSLELASSSPWLGGMVNLGQSQRAPVTTDPGAVFRRLFPQTTAQPTAAPSEREQIAAARRSVLDFVSQEYAAVSPRLGSEDRARLDMHRELIRDLEQRIDSLSSLSCDDRPAQPGSVRQTLEVTRAYADLTAAALACDLTRVVTIQLEPLANAEFDAPAGNVHEDFAHQQKSSPAKEYMTQFGTKHAEVFAYLLSALARYSEGDGTLLDNTAVVWTGELATGDHELHQIPMVLAGSCGGYFRTGRYLSFAQNIRNPTDWEGGFGQLIGPGHSHFLISLMQAMGLSNNTIGMTSTVTRDGKNVSIDLTGPLPRLT